MTNNRKKIITMSAAAALATSLFVGAGTFAYLQANTGTITNKFGKDANDAPVIELSETDVVLDNDGNGEKTYVIENGQTADKDPTVTVNNSMTVFTFIEISDKTTLDGNKIVNYEIADGWTEITGVDCINEDVTGIYYRVVEADADNKEFRSRRKAKNRPYHKENVKQEEKEIDEEEAMKRLLERFGSRH